MFLNSDLKMQNLIYICTYAKSGIYLCMYIRTHTISLLKFHYVNHVRSYIHGTYLDITHVLCTFLS